jgi:hypothetical protein
MRDSHILAGLGQIELKAGHDIKLLAEQVRIVRFRQEAVEEVLFGNRLRTAGIIVLALVNPRVVMRMIDDWTQVFYDRFEDAMKQAQEERTKVAKGIVLPKGVGVIES